MKGGFLNPEYFRKNFDLCPYHTTTLGFITTLSITTLALKAKITKYKPAHIFPIHPKRNWNFRNLIDPGRS